MFNYGPIEFKRFASSFIVKLCNELFFSTAFNTPCICPKIRCDRYCRNFFGNWALPNWLSLPVPRRRRTVPSLGHASCSWWMPHTLPAGWSVSVWSLNQIWRAFCHYFCFRKKADDALVPWWCVATHRTVAQLARLPFFSFFFWEGHSPCRFQFSLFQKSERAD